MHLGVAFQQSAMRHQGGQVGEIGDVEENGQRPDQEGDRIELVQGQEVEQGRNWDRGQHHGPSDVAGDHHRPPPDPVQPGPRQQREEDEGEPLQGGEEADLERAGMQGEDRGAGKREPGHRGPQNAHRLARPEPEEVPVPPEPAAEDHLAALGSWRRMSIA